MNCNFINRLTPRFALLCHLASLLVLASLIGAAPGCARSRYLAVRKVPKNPLAGPLNLLSHQGPRPTERTLQTPDFGVGGLVQSSTRLGTPQSRGRMARRLIIIRIAGEPDRHLDSPAGGFSILQQPGNCLE